MSLFHYGGKNLVTYTAYMSIYFLSLNISDHCISGRKYFMTQNAWPATSIILFDNQYTLLEVTGSTFVTLKMIGWFEDIFKWWSVIVDHIWHLIEVLYSSHGISIGYKCSFHNFGPCQNIYILCQGLLFIDKFCYCMLLRR